MAQFISTPKPIGDILSRSMEERIKELESVISMLIDELNLIIPKLEKENERD